MRFSIICAVALMLASGAMSADRPAQQGSYILSGQASVTYQGGDLYEYHGDGITTVLITPEFSYFIADGIAIGYLFDLIVHSQGGAHESRFGFGPVVSFYLYTARNRAEAKGAILPVFRVMAERTSYSDGNSETMWTVGGFIGVDVMISNSIAIQPGVQLRNDFYKPEYESTVHGFSVMGGVGIEAFVF